MLTCQRDYGARGGAPSGVRDPPPKLEVEFILQGWKSLMFYIYAMFTYCVVFCFTDRCFVVQVIYGYLNIKENLLFPTDLHALP